MVVVARRPLKNRLTALLEKILVQKWNCILLYSNHPNHPDHPNTATAQQAPPQPSKSDLCDASSNSLSGYMDISGSEYDKSNENKHLFYWFFEKRGTDSDTAPVSDANTPVRRYFRYPQYPRCPLFYLSDENTHFDPFTLFSSYSVSFILPKKALFSFSLYLFIIFFFFICFQENSFSLLSYYFIDCLF